MPQHDDSLKRAAPPSAQSSNEEAFSSEDFAHRFALQELLGSGASGDVYQAYDRTRGATIAIKFLTALDPASLVRFKSEFRTLANLAHPNLLQLYELLSCGNDWLLTMELVVGTDFLTHVRPNAPGESDARVDDASSATAVSGQGPARAFAHQPLADTSLSPAPDACLASPDSEARLRDALLQLCAGLQALHRANRLHRDLKPANVLVSTADGRVVICDFGLALEGTQPRRANPEGHAEEPSSDSRFESRQREVAGTLIFMSPEQARAETLTPASDWYSVGVMLYQALTGRVPHGRSLSYQAALNAKLYARPLHPAQLVPGITTELAELTMALLHPDPRRRAGYAEVMAVLEGSGSAKRPPPRLRASGALVGREAQLALLWQAFTASQRGAPSIALVSGPSGMGKSALVQTGRQAVGTPRSAR